jgi:hypothetical protein
VTHLYCTPCCTLPTDKSRLLELCSFSSWRYHFFTGKASSRCLISHFQGKGTKFFPIQQCSRPIFPPHSPICFTHRGEWGLHREYSKRQDDTASSTLPAVSFPIKIHTMDFIIHSMVYMIHSMVFIIHRMNLRSLRQCVTEGCSTEAMQATPVFSKVHFLLP